MKEKFGLRELPKDNRDFKLGYVFALPKLEELPNDFTLGEPIIKHQGNTDFCSAYTSCGMSEFQEGVELYPAYSFALSKAISGNPDEWGQNLRVAMKSHTKYGAIKMQDINKEELPSKDQERHIDQYHPEYLILAKKHKKQSYFKIEGRYDDFNNIRASIYKFRNKKQAVALGVVWSWGFPKYLSGVVNKGFGHAIYAFGWDGDYLLIANSYGKEAGENGTHYLHKDTVNYFVKRFGSYMMVDIPEEEAKELNKRGEWRQAGWIGKLIILLNRKIGLQKFINF